MPREVQVQEAKSRFAVGDRVRFKLEHVLAVQDVAGTVERAFPDGCIFVGWDSGDATYIEMAQQEMIEHG